MVNDTTFISFTKSNVDYLSKEAFNLFSDAYLKYASESEVEYRNPGCFTANYYDYRGRRTKRVTVTLGVECIQIMSFITDKTVRYRYWKPIEVKTVFTDGRVIDEPMCEIEEPKKPGVKDTLSSMIHNFADRVTAIIKHKKVSPLRAKTRMVLIRDHMSK